MRTVRQLALTFVVALSAMTAAHAGQWTALGPFGGSVRKLARDSRHPDRILLGTSAGQIYISEDAGGSWSRLTQFGDDGRYVVDNIAVDPDHPETIYAAAWRLDGGGDLFRSRDGGKTWQTLPDMHGKSIRAMALAPSQPRLVVAGALDGVYRSTDGGDTWARISPEGHPELKNVESVAIDPYHPEQIYVGTWHLPWKTSDGGQTWRSIKNGLQDDSDVFSILIERDRPTVIYASACTGIYRSNSAGELFQKVQGIPESARRTRSLQQDPTNPDIVYAGTTEGLWKTQDGGETWVRLTPPSRVVNDILIDPRHPARVLLATDRGGVLASDDGGANFAPSNRGFSNRQTTAVVVDRDDPDTVYASVINDQEFGGVFVSHDGGAQWAQINEGLDGHDVFTLHQTQDGALLAGTMHGVYAFRKDGGEWRPINFVLQRKPSPRARNRKPAPPVWIEGELDARIAQLEILPGRWLAATSSGLFTSLDQGRSWHGGPLLREQNLIAITSLNGVVLVASTRAVLLSRNGGVSWRRLTLPSYVTAISGVAVTPESLWVTTNQGAFFSSDGGGTWEHVIVGMPARNLAVVAYDLEGRRLLGAAASSGEIFESVDNGRTWKRTAESGWPVRSLIVTRGRLLAATLFDGIVAPGQSVAADATKPAANTGK